MPKIVTTKAFIKKAVNTHGFTYCYNKVKYVDSKTKVTITCREHGDFKQKPNCHLTGKGCPKCGGKEKLTVNNFIQKAREIHGDKYDYNLAVYKNSKNKVDIICYRHGLFKQRVNNHLSGVGCPECAVDEHERTGWNLFDWKKVGLHSENFDSFKVYIIKCWNEDEEFYKIGRTFTTLKQRFSAEFYMPYNWKIVKIFEGEAKDMYYLEKILQNKNFDFKYLPTKKFSGARECFKTINYVN